MLNENISAANMKKNEIISFDGYPEKQINGKDSLDETVEYFRDYYNVNSFSETELDVVIVYSDVATDLVMYFAEKFSEAKSVSVFNLSIIAPVIVRRRKMKPPVKVSFMGSSVVIGDNKNCTEIKADHTDLKFMFDTDNSFWDDESRQLKIEIKKLKEQISKKETENARLNTAVNDEKLKTDKKAHELSQKDIEIQKLKKKIAEKNEEIEILKSNAKSTDDEDEDDEEDDEEGYDIFAELNQIFKGNGKNNAKSTDDEDEDDEEDDEEGYNIFAGLNQILKGNGKNNAKKYR